ncbi:MAG: hypothetical protein ACI8XO_004287 [Verrucomicrobiales bacterium]
MTAPDDLEPGAQFEIEAAASWQICDDKFNDVLFFLALLAMGVGLALP